MAPGLIGEGVETARRLAGRVGRRLAALGQRPATPSAGPGPDHEGTAGFIETAYRELLGREADPSGLAHYLSVARERGLGPVVLSLATSSEHLAHVVSTTCPLPDIRRERPDRYVKVAADDGREVELFLAESVADFDWLLAKIIEHGYYERPASWSLDADADKVNMADLVASLATVSAQGARGRVLEIGCSNGLVLSLLAERGLDVAGVDISRSSVERAPASVRDRIVLGELPTADVGDAFDLVFGLDVFEHLHPRHLGAYLARAHGLLVPGGRLLANIPAFGDDPMFGEVFPMWFGPWRDDAAAGRPFRHIEVDPSGFPCMGHLIWAAWDWWVDTIEARGFRRLPAVEAEAHRRFDGRLASSPARLAFFVFEKAGG